jgi:hypothetical protein
VDEYFDDPAIDDVNRHLFAFAAYDAGPNRIARLRRLAPEYDADRLRAPRPQRPRRITAPSSSRANP